MAQPSSLDKITTRRVCPLLDATAKTPPKKTSSLDKDAQISITCAMYRNAASPNIRSLVKLHNRVHICN